MQKLIKQVEASIGEVLLGKHRQVQLAVCCLLSDGHLLIEDLPGMGKTTLSQALATVLGLKYSRIQFTSDIMPADILGFSSFDRTENKLVFQPGPIFNELVLADEINRTTPKSQSALLEAMEERQVTIEGSTRALPEPFFVIATQNPSTQAGTYPLPESQLDRFLMRIELGYPTPEAERELLEGEDRRAMLRNVACLLDHQQLKEMQQACAGVKASSDLIAYIQRLVQFSRESGDFAYGLSPRGGLALLKSAKTWAYMQSREYVVPEDVQAILPSVVEHRLRDAADYAGHRGGSLSQRLIQAVAVVA